MAAPTATGIITPILAPSGSTDTGQNTPVAPTYPGVLAAGLSSTNDATLVLPSNFAVRRAASFSSSGAAASTNGFYGGGLAHGLPINGNTGYIFGHFSVKGSGTGLGTIAQNGVVIAARSGVGNWRRWTIGGYDIVVSQYPHIRINEYVPFLIAPATTGDFADDGTFDPASIDLVEFHWNRVGSGAIRLYVDDCLYISNLAISEGEVGNKATLNDLSDRFEFVFGSATPAQLIITQGQGQYYSYIPIKIAPNGGTKVEFEQSFSLEFAKSSIQSVKVDGGFYDFSLATGNSDGSIISITNSLISADRELSLTTEIGTGVSSTFRSVSISAPGANTLDANFVGESLSLIGRAEIDLQGTLIDSTVRDSSANGVSLNGGQLANCIIRDSASAGVRIPSAGDYSESTATLNNNGTYDVYIDGTVVNGETVDISGFEFPASSTTPTNIYWAGTTGEITVTVSQAGLSTDSAGGTITLAEPNLALTASNFADDIRIYTARYQTFIINSADINAAADEITLGADNETGAAFAGQITTPATLAYLVAAPGATLPTTTPQINTANLYYVVASSGGVIQLSKTEGGAAIAFSDTGTESGGYLFSLTCTTQLSNEIISGGNGFSASYALPDGALIEVAAQGIAANESTATTLFHRIVEWSSTGGASIADTFSLANNPDLIYNQLIGEPLTSDRGIQVTVTNTPSEVAGISFDVSGNIELDANAITDATLNAPDAYLWSIYQRYTADGIRYIRNQFSALSVMQYVFSGLTIDNVADGIRNSPATPLVVYGNLYPATGTNIFASATGTIRVEPFFVTDITSAGDGSFTSSDRTQLDELYATLESSGVFSTNALANAPSGGGSGDATAANQTTIINHLTDIKGPTWTTTDSLEAIRDRGDIAWITATGFSTLVQADIRTALGVASANLDTQLGNIPTTAAFEARTLPSANYFDPSADEVTVGSNNDKSGYSLTQSFPANFANLGISTEGYINRVVTNSDMRGTDGALLAGNYTAPDNSAIADIKTKTDQLTFTVANQVDANALTGGGGDDAETIFTYFSGQGYTADRAGYLDKLNLPGALTQTSDLPANFSDLAIAETTGLVSIGTLPTIPTNWLTASGIAADAIAEIQSGLSTLTEVGVRSAVGLLTANLDTQLAAIGTDIDAVLVDTGTSIPNTLTTLQTSVNDLPDEVAAQSAIAQLIAQSNQMSQSLGRVTGYTATVLDATDEANGYVLVEDGLGATVFRQTTIKNGDGSVTVSLDA